MPEEQLRKGQEPVQSPEAGVHWCVLAEQEGAPKKVKKKGSERNRDNWRRAVIR